MPDALTPREIAALRQFHDGKHHMEDDACLLVAHIDALTAAVRPYIEGRPDSHIVPMTVGQLRAILNEEPHDA